ncbi:hypothetical protein A3D85_01455 [Candidatus Amesbacteria bacterium RIFCSPHIGHO2_02_FULL_47_9]|uniref:Uncharacterized protein n=1 Tax=Candidatus Amesbacteria bacterium RIFCSPHIGHO2_01_FULL_48_32b TaxID=1797253 RepID=A0A1F4YCW0_9BACT|nr:MAG: hypothetical protein A2876_04555 [Candidatus Amesbacteria bacterium RIFCSPHIGHO2_01_FULL_48_32b]OGD04268.1 MAG: hypothetical protein A3D85_01455 [Candidatus Amesbacteria bacterium RIFCSPHIGHO2_02_FULL_47_9]OGD08208.1 MAG: hypothetical protein A2899_02980 [Candidatus Amesbacteria bacterium RIFCSPLOWO2_01_FULL_49_25]
MPEAENKHRPTWKGGPRVTTPMNNLHRGQLQVEIEAAKHEVPLSRAQHLTTPSAEEEAAYNLAVTELLQAAQNCLNSREQEALDLYLQGHTHEEIAWHLHLHRVGQVQHILDRSLHTLRRTQAARNALGLLQLTGEGWGE